MTMPELRNAKIATTNLGFQLTDQGMLSFLLNLDYGGAGQGFGGVALDGKPAAQSGDRRPSTLPGSLLLAIDKVFACDWEKLPGTPCRAFIRNGLVVGIGHFLEDKWLYLDNENLCYRVSSYEEMSK